MTAPPSDAELAGTVRALSGARVLVLGDVILDRYVIGHAARLSPEAPIPVLRPQRGYATLGGAANVALNVAALGGRAWLCGVVGADAAADEMRRLLAAEPGIRAALLDAPDRPTTTKTRFVAGTHQLMRLDEETTAPVGDVTAARVLAEFRAALPETDIVVLSDYAKGVLSDAVLPEALRLAREAGRRVIADPKRADFAAYRGADILTPNELETRAATGIDAAGAAGAERAGRAVLAATGGEAVLVTRSERGVTLVRREGGALHVPTRARAVADVSGAGDTLVAALAVALGAGARLPVAAALANVTAGLSVAKPGTATVTAAELTGALHLRELAATDSKIVSAEEADAHVAAWRAAGLKVGFANGCFDLIHPGHVRLLTEARAACDRLIVALNTDASVRRLKGPARPVQSEQARATVMASLAPVDLVVLFAEDTPRELIARLRPDVLVKGSDYTVETVVGADVVAAYGGRVLLVDLQEGHSTTGTIRRMGGQA
ncbi:MAG: D-glycero-beta-D-manno-heptose-7-phosphate kinase [Proteobacteria bacterium]|nr:D-glycero-beta-D-manno-heptose-7-phosphate kinase [Pseudomonadota bacterium]